MFFPDRIKSITARARVLEVGPGSSPHPRADAFLERRFSDESTAHAQRGYAPNTAETSKTVFYDGGRFPFPDQQFDYVICSHVLEHVPVSEFDGFIAELQRVAPRGYIEYPNVLYELINYQPVHIWLMGFRDSEILLLDKQLFPSSHIHEVYRQLMYAGNAPYSLAHKAFTCFPELFFVGYEWERCIRYRMISDLKDLFDASDRDRAIAYIGRMAATLKPVPQTEKLRLINRAVQGVRRRARGAFRRSGLLQCSSCRVHRTAVIEPRHMVHLEEGCEIKDYVVIRSTLNPVRIGRYTQLNPFTVIYGGSGVTIGDNVMIAPHCVIAAGNHDYKQIEKPMRWAGSLSKGPIIIEDNVWIGANCTITDGVRIGRDAVIGANSVVTRDVAPYDIVGGVPARVLGNRRKAVEEQQAQDD